MNINQQEQQVADKDKVVRHADFRLHLKKKMQQELKLSEKFFFYAVILPQQRLQTFTEQARDIGRDFKVLQWIVKNQAARDKPLTQDNIDEISLRFWKQQHPEKKWWLRDVVSKEVYLDSAKLESMLARNMKSSLGKEFNSKVGVMARAAFREAQDHSIAVKDGRIRPVLFHLQHFI